ncbi:unnamed protein product [Aureobasidium uvarum]|uniref:SprT-like domain-containing protein n=1 Tax=Aureobasidium uvarum TaxID=2773716 RepID=A0A9N8KHP3_9PEZI|nr:unnamed protein product [Aureobasidium uvarum]
MSTCTSDFTASREKPTFSEPPCKDLVTSSHAVSSDMDPLDKVRAQAYRDACRAAYFNVEKVHKAEEFIKELDQKLTGGQIGEMTASTGGVKVVWKKRLTAKAGQARCKSRPHPSATIELSDKLLDDQERLINTVAHEFCHVANILLCRDRSHGPGFKEWGRQCEAAFRDLGIKITTKHTYRSKFEFIWTCCDEKCGKEVGRHTKSINPKTQSCRYCGGLLVQTNPVARTLKPRLECKDKE